MSGHPAGQDDAFLAGYLRGVEVGTASGHAAGYAEGLAVLDDAAGALARTRPARAVQWAAARARRGEYPAPAKSAEQIRMEAARSWGLPLPADQAQHDRAGHDQVEAAAAVDGAELADEDDWAWAP